MNPVPDAIMLRQGAIFRMTHEFGGEGEKYRFFIVLNHDPQSDKIIVLATTTTQRAKLERLYRKEKQSPLVYIHPNECEAVTEFCVINCKSPISMGKDELLSNFRVKRHEFVGRLPDSKLQEIHAYIAQAQNIPYSLKCLIIKQ
jgi:hypothetical protein